MHAEKILDRVILLKAPYISYQGKTASVNMFLLLGSEPLLIDAGPWKKNLSQDLSRCIAQFGLSLSDISRVVLTHGHPDHAGGAVTLSKKINISTMIHADAKDYVENYGQYINNMKNLFQRRISRYQFNSVPQKNAYLSIAERFWRPTHGIIKIRHQLFEGDIIETGNIHLEVIYTGGHSPWDISLWEKKSNLIFTGDFLMEKMTTLTGSLMGLGSDLKNYIASLEKLKTIIKGNELVIPSHGNIFRDPLSALKKNLKTITEREQKIITALKREPKALLELESIFPPNDDPLIFARRVGMCLGSA